ncbi:hypothetical protein BC2230_40835 [Burkholderia cepacia]
MATKSRRRSAMLLRFHMPVEIRDEVRTDGSCFRTGITHPLGQENATYSIALDDSSGTHCHRSKLSQIAYMEPIHHK